MLRCLFLQRCLFLLLLLGACRHREERSVQRSFYHWKTVVRLSPKTQHTLQQLAVNNLYVRFFDVDWDAEATSARPVAKTIFQDSLPQGITITPVVFLTQEPLRRLDVAGLEALAKNTASLLAATATTNNLQLSNEVQLDCDWTAATRDNYFAFLAHLKKQSFFQGKVVSATVRLHQLKFISQAGVPPVNKALLMCYNMGNLRNAKTTNSVLDLKELLKYVNTLDSYPLPLDVALPIFDWWVLFEGENYKGLLRDLNPGGTANQSCLYFSTDTTVNGYAFKGGQWLRHETSDATEIDACAKAISQKLKARQLAVILYHLDDRNLAKYSLHELESFYNRFR